MVATYGPDQRALLESAGVGLFERVLADDGIAGLQAQLDDLSADGFHLVVEEAGDDPRDQLRQGRTARTTSTRSPLFTDPSIAVPRIACRRAWSATPGLR